jgi:phosphotransferase system HPr (HPr) family protein
MLLYGAINWRGKFVTSAWLEKTINLKNKHALHMRPAQRIVEVASKFNADVRAVKDTLDCNAKSILDMIEFAAHMVRATKTEDNSFQFRASGTEAQQALDALTQLTDDGFGLE